MTTAPRPEKALAASEPGEAVPLGYLNGHDADYWRDVIIDGGRLHLTKKPGHKAVALYTHPQNCVCGASKP
jgi:hypothetical protein